MNKNSASILLSALLGCGLAAFAAGSYADEHEYMGHSGHGHMMAEHECMEEEDGNVEEEGMEEEHGPLRQLLRFRMHMAIALGLSEEQRMKIRTLREELRHKNWERRGMIIDERAKLLDLYEADRLDAKAIGAVRQKICDLRRQNSEARIETLNRMADVLTADQRSKLKEMRESWRSGE